jgi:broad specificity phosphatase PhoE
MDIFLIRHGEAAASWGESADPGLSDLGREQSIAVVRELRGRLPAVGLQLISSPKARARETAEPLASELGLPVQVNAAFQEIQAPVPLAQRQGWLRQFMQQRWAEQPLSLHHWRDTAVNALMELDSPAVIFTHFLIINAIVGRIQGAQETLCCWPDNASVTHLRRGESGLELLALGRQMRTLVN